MKRIIVTLALFFCLTTTAYATELLMFSMKSCSYCRGFLKEVAQEYNNNPEHAKLLPLRIISMDRPKAPKWFDEAYDRQAIDGIQGTPTFIVWDGEERARLVGYTGKERFLDDISRFINSNRSQLESRVGQNKIPFEKESEMTPEFALAESMGESPDRAKAPTEGFSSRQEGSHSDSVPKQNGPTVPFLAPPSGGTKSKKPIGPMNEFGDPRVPPEGVINSRDLFQHMYKTPSEAVKASHWFGCHGTIHYHEKEDVWMPCEMN